MAQWLPGLAQPQPWSLVRPLLPTSSLKAWAEQTTRQGTAKWKKPVALAKVLSAASTLPGAWVLKCGQAFMCYAVALSLLVLATAASGQIQGTLLLHAPERLKRSFAH